MTNPLELPIRDAGTGVNDGALPPCLLKREATGHTCPYTTVSSRPTENEFIASIRAHKIQFGFLYFLLLFLR